MNQIIGLTLCFLLLCLLGLFFYFMHRGERIKKLKAELAEAKHDASEWRLRHHAVEQMYNDAQTKHEQLLEKITCRTNEKFFKLERKPVSMIG